MTKTSPRCKSCGAKFPREVIAALETETPAPAAPPPANDLDLPAEPRARIDAIDARREALLKQIGDLSSKRAEAMREFVESVGGATKAAEILGIHRPNVHRAMRDEK